MPCRFSVRVFIIASSLSVKVQVSVFLERSPKARRALDGLRFILDNEDLHAICLGTLSGERVDASVAELEASEKRNLDIGDSPTMI